MPGRRDITGLPIRLENMERWSVQQVYRALIALGDHGWPIEDVAEDRPAALLGALVAVRKFLTVRNHVRGHMWQTQRSNDSTIRGD